MAFDPCLDTVGFPNRVFEIDVELEKSEWPGCPQPPLPRGFGHDSRLHSGARRIPAVFPESFVSGPASSIGKSGEMKSPGGQMSDSGLYRGQRRTTRFGFRRREGRSSSRVSAKDQRPGVERPGSVPAGWDFLDGA